uniref:Putative hepatoma-derived growth factor-related protein 2 n=1 Tax=Xenopsylla cheopis TaxID=163159 RepID=A0A6M2DWH1_XENCH
MPKKLKNANGYNVDDLVFARVRGYPPWPARIVEVGLKYKVIFFGTKETGLIKIEDIFNYEENRESFKKKFSKRKYYQEALSEITVACNTKKRSNHSSPKVESEVQETGENVVTSSKSSDSDQDDEELKAESNTNEHKEETHRDSGNSDSPEVKEEEPKPGTSQSTSKRVLYDSQSPPPKRVKVEPPTSYILDYAYLEDSTLKYERDNIVYTTYTLAELQNIGVQHGYILNSAEVDDFKGDDYTFVDPYSVALIYEPLIHPVVFGLHITKHRPDREQKPLERLEWEAKMINDVQNVVIDLRKNCKNIQEVIDDYYLELTDFEELMGTIKIILTNESLNELQKKTIKRELNILKIVLSIRESVPINIKDETSLVKAHELLRFIREKYMPTFLTVMKHPVIVECFFKLTKYYCKLKLENEDIVDKIKTEATAITNHIRDCIKVRMSDEDFTASFWNTYLTCLKRFRSLINSVCRFDFAALTSLKGCSKHPTDVAKSSTDDTKNSTDSTKQSTDDTKDSVEKTSTKAEVYIIDSSDEV